MLNYKRYKGIEPVVYPERTWPDKQIDYAPSWCSVDLRDGNQALIEPMVVEEKIEMFDLLIKLGFKEIEIGFPSASQIEYDFLRELIEGKKIPDDVTVQVLVQCREDLIRRTFEALEGAKRAIVHIYNSTSILQRDVVFNKGKSEIMEIAIQGTKLVQKYADTFGGEIILEYSPESFTGTELDYALDICEAVQRTWNATKEKPIIINLPATVEMTTPNVYADQIEWMHTHFKNRDSIILSVHPHNDRGTGVAATELALLAGADRVEGTLFGNGERTGNIDILTVAYNMFSHGINPELDLSNINEIIEVYERCCKMQVHMRHPYAGKLVFTAFSGSHQDAINKGIQAMEKRKQSWWEVPYLPIDPCDVGREYEPIVRINSQSGKGGVAFIMDSQFGYQLPKGMHKEFANVIQVIAEKTGEVAPPTILEEFNKQYLRQDRNLRLNKITVIENTEDITSIQVKLNQGEKVYSIQAEGNGPLDATKNALEKALGISVEIIDYMQHSLSRGSGAKAAAYLAVRDIESGKVMYGVGVSSNITIASIRALFSGINRLEV